MTISILRLVCLIFLEQWLISTMKVEIFNCEPWRLYHKRHQLISDYYITKRWHGYTREYHMTILDVKMNVPLGN